MLASVLVWHALRENEQAHLSRSTGLQGESIRNEINSRLEYRVQGLREIAQSFPRFDRFFEQDFQREADIVARPLSAYHLIEALDAQQRISWAVSPRAGPKLAGFSVSNNELLHQAWAHARESRGIVASLPVRLGGRPLSVFFFVPIFHGERFLGELVGVIDPSRFFEIVLPASFAPNYAFSIWDGGQRIFQRAADNRNENKGKMSEVPFRLYGRDWKVRVWPTARWVRDSRSLLPEMVLFLCMILSAVLAYCVQLLLLFQERAEQLRHEVGVRRRTEAELKGFNDNLERVVAERTEAVNNYADDLARSNADLEQFAFIISHDLKEPLRMVSSYVQLLQRRYAGKIDREADEFIDFAVDGARRMALLIDSLLKYSRVGRSETRLTMVNCNESLDAVLHNLRTTIAEKNARVQCGDMPTVLADPQQIIQVFQNLIANAIKFTSGGAPEIEIGAERDGDFWKFHVSDNGLGINPRDYDRIFVLFQRLQTSERFAGTGIGLAICKKIVESWKGRIWVESTQGKGSTFYFTVPAGTAPSELSPPLSDRPAIQVSSSLR